MGLTMIILASIIGFFTINYIFLYLQEMPYSRFGRSLVIHSMFAGFLFPHRMIRVSMAYIFSIPFTCDNEIKYLAIYNEGGRKNIQPIGGVYEFYKSERIKPLLNINPISDYGNTHVTKQENIENDLRIKFKIKYFKTFIKWFDSGVGREINIFREFKEELIDSNILEKNKFNYQDIMIRKEKSLDCYYGKIDHNKYGFRHFDIFQIDMTSKLQNYIMQVAEDNMKINNMDTIRLVLISAEDIINGFVNLSGFEVPISEHTKFLIKA
ncbi:MAG: hypothetical protein QM644_03515 [Mobilitalea sp.]